MDFGKGFPNIKKIILLKKKIGRNMKINITKKEYRLLLDILSIADWVMNAYQTEDDPRTKPYEDLEQKFLSYAKDFGFENLIVYDQSSKA